MDKLKEAFILGMQDGWREASAPFVALFKAFAATWRTHRNQHHHGHASKA